ncbi:hypothetical protein [Dyadobacter sp.]|uniref:hypothetical protein n=1 Tax=Dyadobacter sp. TaxID=1914288 RepID=UPI0032658347
MKPKQHTLEFIKRLAKKMKKEKGITHTQALEAVCIEIGYDSYKHCLQCFDAFRNQFD